MILLLKMEKKEQLGVRISRPMNYRISFIAALIAIVLFLAACKNDQPVEMPPPTKLKIPTFNANNAYQNIETQLDFGYRVPGTEAHAKAVEWMTNKLKENGAKVKLQKFKASFQDQKNVQCTNIMAQINPQNPKRILLAAHFDSRMVAEKDDERQDEPIPGADDGGSGVGVLIELSRLLKENPIGIGVDILLFDAEDQGDSKSHLTWALGSQYWSKNVIPKGYAPQYGVLLDMVGSDKATFGREENSKVFAPEIQNKIWGLANKMGYSDFFQDFNAGPVTDDHYFVNRDAKIKMVDIINQSPKDGASFGTYHHTHDDDISVISKRTLRVVGQVITALLYNESNGTI